MRIVAGKLRGRTILTPQGLGVRPTSDRARQAVFNILEHAPWSDGIAARRVIELFAGSGAMGLEALSRGAAACLFVDRAESSLSAIRANLAALGLGPRARTLRQDAARLPRLPDFEAPFDLALLDPPYGEALGEPALMALRSGDWLAPGAIAVVERGAAEPPLALPGFEVVDQRRYGVAQISFLRLA